MVETVNESAPTCPWCSATLPSADAAACPSCGATLVGAGGAEPVLPGVTAIDTEAILRARVEPPRQRNRLLSFLSGEVVVDTDAAASAGSLAPPPDEVRREMLRLQLDAERTRLEADRLASQNDAIVDAIDKGRLVLTGRDGAAAPAADAAAAPVADAPPIADAALEADATPPADAAPAVAAEPGTPPPS